MSSLPDIHIDLLASVAQRVGMTLQKSTRGYALSKGGQTFRFEAFDDFVSGSVLRSACTWLEVDPAAVAEAITSPSVAR